MDLRAFARDFDACAHSPWLASDRLKAFGALMIERWNDPRLGEAGGEVHITHQQRRWQLPMRMSSEVPLQFDGRVIDGSWFPTSGALNPALTIAANALGVASHLNEVLP